MVLGKQVDRDIEALGFHLFLADLQRIPQQGMYIEELRIQVEVVTEDSRLVENVVDQLILDLKLRWIEPISTRDYWSQEEILLSDDDRRHEGRRCVQFPTEMVEVGGGVR